MIERKRKQKAGKAPSWITTMSDLNNLMLTFFILLYILTDVEVEKIPNFFPSPFSGGLGPLEGGQTLEPGKLAEMGNSIESLPSTEKGDKLAKAVDKAISYLQPEILGRRVRIQLEERGIVITLGSDFYFRPASVELNQNALQLLQKIFIVLESMPNKIRIEGHTDNKLIPGDSPVANLFPSNWELSSQRAINVLKYLEELGLPSNRMFSVAYGETRPIETNETPEGRAYNRRVEIIILREDEQD